VSEVTYHVKNQLTQVEQRQEDRRQISGQLKTWKPGEDEPEGDGADLENLATPELLIVKTANGNLDLISSTANLPSTHVVARVSAKLVGSSPRDGESGTVTFVITPAETHLLRYDAGSDWREVIELTLCGNDLLTIDDHWGLHYVNNKVRTRAEVEAAQGDDLYV
jgi:hypothetical protein